METSAVFDQLKSTLLTARMHMPYVSMRIWFEGDDLKFFLTNLPPRGRRRDTFTSNITKPSQVLQENCVVSTPAEDPPPPLPTLPTRTCSSVARQGRPRRKRRCPPSRSQSPTEELREEQIQGNRSTSTSADISNFDGTRNLSIATIPCRNSFEILADLQDSSEEYDPSERECYTPPIGCSKLCEECGLNRVETKCSIEWRCKQCLVYVHEFNKLNPSGQDCGDDSN